MILTPHSDEAPILEIWEVYCPLLPGSLGVVVPVIDGSNRNCLKIISIWKEYLKVLKRLRKIILTKSELFIETK